MIDKTIFEKYLLEQINEAQTATPADKLLTKILETDENCQSSLKDKTPPVMLTVMIPKSINKHELETVITRFITMNRLDAEKSTDEYLEIFNQGKHIGCVKFRIIHSRNEDRTQKNLLSIYYNVAS